MAIKKRYYARRTGRKRRGLTSRTRRTSKFSSGNKRSGGLYRLSSRGLRRRAGVNPELKYLNSGFANDNCCTADGAGTVDNIPGANQPFKASDNRWYCNIGSTTLANPNGWVGICRPSQGPGASQRIGRKVCLKSLQMRWRFREGIDDNTDSLGAGARVIVLLDTQTNGTLPKIDDVLDISGGAGSASNSNTGGINGAQLNMSIENSQRFRALLDKHILISSPSGANFNTANPPVGSGMFRQNKERYWAKWMKLPNIEIEMGGDNSNPTICKSNSIHVLVYPTGGPTFISGNFRTRFTDV